MRPLVVMLTVLFVSASSARAHEGHLHLGTPTRGVVDARSGDHLTLRTEHGPIAVTITEHTTVVEGDRPTGHEAIRVGEALTVFGTMLPGGELVARDIHIDAPGASPSPSSH